MAILTIQDVAVSGAAAITWTAAAGGGDEVATGRGVVLLVRNDDAAPHTLTVATAATVRGIPLDDVTVAVAAGDVAAVPMDDVYRNPATRRAALSLDAATGVEYAALRMPR